MSLTKGTLQNTIEKSEHNRKSIIQSKNWNTYRKNRTTYKKIKTGETQKHQNIKEKGSAADTQYQLQK